MQPSTLLTLALSTSTGAAATIGVAQFFNPSGPCDASSQTGSYAIQDVRDVCQDVSSIAGTKQRVRIVGLTLPQGYNLRIFNPTTQFGQFNFNTFTQNGTTDCVSVGTAGFSYTGIKVYNNRTEPFAC